MQSSVELENIGICAKAWCWMRWDKRNGCHSKAKGTPQNTKTDISWISRVRYLRGDQDSCHLKNGLFSNASFSTLPVILKAITTSAVTSRRVVKLTYAYPTATLLLTLMSLTPWLYRVLILSIPFTLFPLQTRCDTLLVPLHLTGCIYSCRGPTQHESIWQTNQTSLAVIHCW